MKTIRHKTRPSGQLCSDRTEWLVLETSPSFFIVYSIGQGISVKRKDDYELVETQEGNMKKDDTRVWVQHISRTGEKYPVICYSFSMFECADRNGGPGNFRFPSCDYIICDPPQ